MIARLAAAIAAALLLAACGGDGDGRWDAEVAATRAALEAGDRDGALASLEEIAADAHRAHTEGDLSDEELFELTSLVEQARAQVDVELPEPTTTTPPTTADTTPPETAPPVVVEDTDDDDDDDKRGKRGKGRGGDDGDGDD